MENQEIVITLVPFDGTEAAADSLYSNPAYDDSFKFRTKWDDVFTGNLGWEQGRGNNYRFYVSEYGGSHYYLPEDVTHVEKK